MELTPDLIAVQGILSCIVKQTGEFSKINYRGGKKNNLLKFWKNPLQVHVVFDWKLNQRN